MIFPTTPSQTVGPFFSIGLRWPEGPNVVPEGTPGAIRVAGTVIDGRGAPVPDHVVESWQCDPDGRFADLHGHSGRSTLAGFRGFGRNGEEAGNGTWSLLTVKPGRIPGPGGVLQAPHVDLSIFARGMLNRLVTRLYFADEPEANSQDPVLRSIPETRRATVLAEPVADGYRLDLRLQGPEETVFFAL